jgi:hypothetical protein
MQSEQSVNCWDLQVIPASYLLEEKAIVSDFEQTGGCVCGKTRYVLTHEPITIYACHCARCQTRTGSAFGVTMIVPTAYFQLTGGSTEGWLVNVDSREYVWEKCFECRTDLYAEIRATPDILAVWAGTFDDVSWIAPKAHIWAKNKQGWFRFAESDVVYDEQPEDLFSL